MQNLNLYYEEMHHLVFRIMIPMSSFFVLLICRTDRTGLWHNIVLCHVSCLQQNNTALSSLANHCRLARPSVLKNDTRAILALWEGLETQPKENHAAPTAAYRLKQVLPWKEARRKPAHPARPLPSHIYKHLHLLIAHKTISDFFEIHTLSLQLIKSSMYVIYHLCGWKWTLTLNCSKLTSKYSVPSL